MSISLPIAHPSRPAAVMNDAAEAERARFWSTPETWPRDTENLMFLPRALLTIARAKIEGWRPDCLIAQVAKAPPEPKAISKAPPPIIPIGYRGPSSFSGGWDPPALTPEERAYRQRAHEEWLTARAMMRGAFEVVAAAAEAGSIETVARGLDIPAGVPLPQTEWFDETPDAVARRFVDCRQPGTRWLVYVTRKSLTCYLAPLPELTLSEFAEAPFKERLQKAHKLVANKPAQARVLRAVEAAYPDGVPTGVSVDERDEVIRQHLPPNRKGNRGEVDGKTIRSALALILGGYQKLP